MATKLSQDIYTNQARNTPFQGSDGNWYINYANPIMGQGDEGGLIQGYTPVGTARVSGKNPVLGETTQWYDPNTGEYTGESKYKEGTSNLMKDLMTWGVLSGGAALGLNALGFGGAGTGGALGANGAFLGEGVASGIPAWDGALTASQAGGLGGAGSATFNAAMDSQLANAAIGPEALSGYTAAGAGGVTASPIASSTSWLDKVTSALSGNGGGGASSLLSSLTGGSGNSLLGLGATALGGLAGSKPQEAGGSQTRTMDPRLDQPVFGDLIPRTQQLLAQQMTPERMQGYRQMQQQGLSLLGQPVAGNGFNRFYGG